MNDSSMLASTDGNVIRCYEDAASAIGRLDATARLASAGFRELLVLRSIATPVVATHTGMIALVRADGEGEGPLLGYGHGLRTAAARARGGALPSVAFLHETLRFPPPAWSAAPIDEILRDAHGRTPPVLKAALVVHALLGAARDEASALNQYRLAALAVTLLLCVGGATTDAWLTLPPRVVEADESLRRTFAALAREARACERGVAHAQERADADEQHVRDSLGRAAYSALDVLALLRDELVVTVPGAARALELTPPTAGAAVARLVELGIAREVTGKARSRAFAYEGIIRALEPESTVEPERGPRPS